LFSAKLDLSPATSRISQGPRVKLSGGFEGFIARIGDWKSIF
jgi:hypothetical protein